VKIVQLLLAMSYGDAIGNDVLAIRDIIRSIGYRTDIYAETIDPRLKSEHILHYTMLPLMMRDDILIYHLAISTHLNWLVEKFNCRKIMIYHNITPAEYFRKYNSFYSRILQSGIGQAKYLHDKFDYCIVDSDFNKSDLISYGYKCPIDVLPIIIPFSHYRKKPSRSVMRKYNDGMTNLLFLGRIAPNKKQEDVIAAFYYYQKCYNPLSRLFLVGSWDGTEKYHERLQKYHERLQRYVRLLELDNVIFTGHVKFDEILAYYKIADVFLCMSEHEGFCVPLVEAMFFDIPVVAYAQAAVPSTLGDAGILLKEKDRLLAAGMINALLTDSDLRAQVIETQRKRLEFFSYETVRSQFISYLNTFIENSK
jgi:glycosyltransferase involved in cell wall biosynthesis